MPPRKRKSEATAAVVDEIPKRTRRSLRGTARAGSPEGVSSVEKGLRFPPGGQDLVYSGYIVQVSSPMLIVMSN